MAPPKTPYRLQSALASGKDGLSPAAREEIMALNGPRPWRFGLEVAKAWGVIAAAVAIAAWAQTWYVSLAAVFLVGTRQNCLGLLVHEQTHMGFGGRWGDWFCNFFCAYPLLAITVEGYSQVHLTHHRNYFKDSDPDFVRKSGDEWAFPKSGWQLAKLFLADIFGLNTLRLVRGKRASNGVAAKVVRRGLPMPKWVRPLYVLALFAVVTYLHFWPYFLLYWVLPLATVLPAIVRWGALCEHEYNRPDAGMLESTPIIIQPWWESHLMPMLNFGMHSYHHLWPGLSFSQLNKVHRIFEREGLVIDERVFHGSLAYMRFLLGEPHGKAGLRAPASNAN